MGMFERAMAVAKERRERVVKINNDNVVDFLKKHGPSSTEEIKSRFALNQIQVNDLVDALEETGHIERAWRLGPLWKETDQQ